MTMARLPNCCFDDADPFRQRSRLDWEQFEAEGPVSFFVYFLKTECVFEADSPRFGGGDEAEVANEEDAVLIDRFFLDAIEFTGQDRRIGTPEVHG